MNHTIIWAMTNCNSTEEAQKIGTALLEQRLIACYDVIPERQSAYFWPPKTGKIEKITGSLLIGVSVVENYDVIAESILKLHSDDVPFIGSLTIDKVNKPYYDWLVSELQLNS